MTEPRKIALKSVGPSVSSAKNKDKKEDRPTLKTRRLNLNLTESNDDTCPEFSYLELCSIDDTKSLSDVPPEYDPDDPFAFGDQAAHDKLVSLAKKYEQKYTPKPGKRKRKDRVRDLVDLGDGYDDEDSFVDNSEAYDEYMPCSVSTKYGGFYINSGRLDIVPVDDESNEDVTPCRKKARKMNALTDSEESNSSDDDEPKRKTSIKKRNGKDLTGFNVVKKRIKKSFAPTKVVKKSIGVVKRLNGHKKLDVPEVPVVGELRPIGTHPLPAVVLPLAIVANNCSQLPSSGLASGNQFPTDAEKLFACTVRLSRSNSVLQAEKMDNPDPFDGSEARGINSTTNDVMPKANDSPSSHNVKQVTKDQSNTSVDFPKLREVVDKIEVAARLSEGGKIKQFTPELNELLLRIDNLTRHSSSDVRSHMMNCLGKYFACGKDGLMKRALKRNLTQNDVKMKEATTELKEAVRVALLPLLEKYKSSKTVQAAANAENKSDDGVTNPIRMVFSWSDAVRQKLCRVVKIRLEKYEISKRRGETARSYLEAFLESTIKPLWEDGWVRTSELMRESRSAHARWTEKFKSSKSESVVFVSTTPTSTKGGRKKTDSKNDSKNDQSRKTSSPDDSPVMIDVAVEKSRTDPQTHANEPTATASEIRTTANKAPQPKGSSSNGDLGHSNKVKQLSAQAKSSNTPASRPAEPMVIDLTDDVVDTAPTQDASENLPTCEKKQESSILKPNNVAFWSKCLNQDDNSQTKAEYEEPLKKYMKYYAENGSIVDSETAVDSPTGVKADSTRSMIHAGRTNENANKMDDAAIKRSAAKLIAEAGYGSLISRSNSPADGRSARSSNSKTVVVAKSNGSKPASSGIKTTVTKETPVASLSGKVVVANGHDATNFPKTRQISPPKSVGNKPPTESTKRVESSKPTKDAVQPVAMWCTADLTTPRAGLAVPVPSAPLVGLPGSAANRSMLNGNCYSGLPGGCETTIPRKKSPVPLEIQTSP